MKPSIAILHYTAPPIVGGVESTIAAHARLLADHGYAVKIITGRGEQSDPRVPVQVIPTVDSKHPFVLEVNRKLASGIVAHEFSSLTTAIIHALRDALTGMDLCIAHNVLTLHKNLALTRALYEIVSMRGERLIGWCHDLAWMDPVYADEMHDGLPWDLLRRKWDGVHYVVVSDARRKDLAQLLSIYEADVSIVTPGVDVFAFLGIGETAASWANRLNLLEAQPLLLVPTRVTRRKNIELAIEITAALRQLDLNPKLVVMGPLGPHNPANARYLDELRALKRELGVEDCIIFLNEYGPVDDAARRDLYLLADALLFTSEREGFGIPILEAGLARLPIFCSDIPPFYESARQWAQYFALDQSPADIARQIARGLDSDARYQLKQRVLREYTWPVIFKDKIEPLLREKPV